VTTDGTLTVRVEDSGPGATAQQLAAGGSGLARLRDRLEALYGGTARLEVESAPGAGFRATLVLPQDEP
jgi:signal transduction histidine kinase